MIRIKIVYINVLMPKIRLVILNYICPSEF